MAGEIFISYRRADQAWARLLHRQLRAEGVEAWYDAQIGAGQDWRAATAKALEASRIFVLLFSEHAAQSTDIAKELAAAVQEKKLIIPVRLQNIAPKGAFLYELASRNWINAFDDTEPKLAELARGLADLVKTGGGDESALFEHATIPQPRAREPKPGISAAIALCVILAGSAAGLWWHRARPDTPLLQQQDMRVAVLPFEALANNESGRVFAKAVAEQIVAALNDVQVQTVSGREAETLKGPDRDAVAAKLGTEFILNGSVQDGEKGLRVTMHVDRVPTHATLWTGSYDQGSAAAAEFEFQIAAVAADLAARARNARKEDPDEIDDAALGLVLKTAAGVHTMTQDNFLTQAGMARQLIARAPKYGTAYADLAWASAMLSLTASSDEALSLRADARKAAAQALALKTRDSGAYLALAILVPAGQWAEREAAFRRGLSALPDDASLQNYLAGVLAAVGRQRDALLLNKTSLALDPQSPVKTSGLAVMLAETGHAAEAVSTIDRAAKIWPSNVLVWQNRFYILANSGHVEEARTMLDSEVIPVGLEPSALAARRSYLDALRLDIADAKVAAAKTIQAARTAGDLPASQALLMLAKLGELDSAFAIARDSVLPKTPGRGPSNTFALFQGPAESMRRDPRFMPLAAQAGLVDYWIKTGKWPDFCSQPDLPYDCRAAAKARAPGH